MFLQVVEIQQAADSPHQEQSGYSASIHLDTFTHHECLHCPRDCDLHAARQLYLLDGQSKLKITHRLSGIYCTVCSDVFGGALPGVDSLVSDCHSRLHGSGSCLLFPGGEPYLESQPVVVLHQSKVVLIGEMTCCTCACAC